jgi:hypothetical protein
LSRTFKNEHPRDRRKKDPNFSKAFDLRLILRTQFACRSTQPTQKDADLSTKLTEETMKVLEAGGASGFILQRQVQLFASVTLLELKVGKKPKPEQMARFLKRTMGLEGTLALTREDWNALNVARSKMNVLIAEPKWSKVHGGHVAMTCLTLLSLYDVSVLNMSFSG